MAASRLRTWKPPTAQPTRAAVGKTEPPSAGVGDFNSSTLTMVEVRRGRHDGCAPPGRRRRRRGCLPRRRKGDLRASFGPHPGQTNEDTVQHREFLVGDRVGLSFEAKPSGRVRVREESAEAVLFREEVHTHAVTWTLGLSAALKR